MFKLLKRLFNKNFCVICDCAHDWHKQVITGKEIKIYHDGESIKDMDEATIEQWFCSKCNFIQSTIDLIGL